MIRKILLLGMMCVTPQILPALTPLPAAALSNTTSPIVQAAQALGETVSRIPDSLSLGSDGSFDSAQLEMLQAALKAGTDLYRLNAISPNGKLILSFLKAVDNAKFNYYQQDLDTANRSLAHARDLCTKIVKLLTGNP